MSDHSPTTLQAKKPPAQTIKSQKPVQADLGASAQSVDGLSAAIADRHPASAEDVLRLQQVAGNRAVSRLIQTKLAVGPAGDRYEQEADRVAQQVMSMPAPAPTQSAVQRQGEEEEIQMMPLAAPLAASITPLVQRQEDEEEIQTQPIVQRAPEEEELQMKPLVQRFGEGGFEVDATFEQQLAANQGGGSPLPGTVREFMEPRFGADFSAVRVHTGSESAQLNRSVSAQAFTLGQNIYLGEGKDDINSSVGQALLAHELTHTIQQGAVPVTDVAQRTAGTPKTQPDVIQRVDVKGLTARFEQTAASKKFEPATLNKPTEMQTLARQITISQFIEILNQNSIAFKPAISSIIKYWTPVTLADLESLITAASAADRKTVWSDTALLTQAEAKLGNDSYLTFITKLGMHQAPTTTELEEGGEEHTPAPEADRLIRDKLSGFVANAVTAGRQITGKVAVVASADWDRAGVAHYGNAVWHTGPPPKTPKKQAINGFVDSSGRVWIERNSGNAGTLIHEGMHKYSDGAVLNDLGFDVNEGVTEYFTRIICKDLSIDRGNYEAQFKLIELLATNVASKAIIAAAYFDGNITGLKLAFIAYRKTTKSDSDTEANNRWGYFISFFKNGDFASARKYINGTW